MKRISELNRSIPLHDYRSALKDAVSWLGERYLLAEPVAKRAGGRDSFYNEPPRWHPVLWAATRKVK